ncbi:hypothetical protein B2G50_18275 [Leptospira interrogans serovar Canicola]|nr:hypothetical protein B2G50_18275 [Leptospira interrogans serovar Canicola]
MLIPRETFAEFSGSFQVINKASHFYSRSKLLSVSLLSSIEVTQRLTSMVVRSNSASHFYGRSTDRVL